MNDGAPPRRHHRVCPRVRQRVGRRVRTADHSLAGRRVASGRRDAEGAPRKRSRARPWREGAGGLRACSSWACWCGRPRASRARATTLDLGVRGVRRLRASRRCRTGAQSARAERPSNSEPWLLRPTASTVSMGRSLPTSDRRQTTTSQAQHRGCLLQITNNNTLCADLSRVSWDQRVTLFNNALSAATRSKSLCNSWRHCGDSTQPPTQRPSCAVQL